ncbi:MULTISPECIES: lecithin retinol acyltransferase family protein [Calothrix]|uniref:Lecithin retinol acyltransferase family protein n=2 Tax=Calothrix TaxID=1186 RepID=A0ABR8AD63_9CYAN|nr:MULTISPECIES: lecithin retinol acyltransferase family protein [Calothrix]MBD2197896.1 lecithin retinol acyltransferase family protein [Calothrix parietina FACHB-288]MBD2226300.1 lecithin retinol acyltransferase family protein [Calothrix anomala FACHB-343]
MKAGDHIYIRLKHQSGFKFTHHGIYIGNDEVIHYWKHKVRKTEINKFTLGKNIHIKNHKKEYSSSRVVERAKKRLGENKYNLIFNNCEHFATWCKTGKHKSKQVGGAIPKVPKVIYKKAKKQMSKYRIKIF